VALVAVARIGSGWPSGLLSWWCCRRRRPLCPAVSGRGGTIPRSCAQVRGVFAGGRAHRAAVDLQGEGKQWEGRDQPVGLPVVVELAESVVAAGRLAIVLPVGLGDGAWSGRRGCACQVMQRACPRRAGSARVGDEGWLRDCEGVSPLQPGSLLLIRDRGASSTRVVLGSTPPYRSGPPSGLGKAQVSPGYGSGAATRAGLSAFWP
jgi:hypothetical protein